MTSSSQNTRSGVQCTHIKDTNSNTRFFAPQVFDPPINLSKTLSLTMGNPTGLCSLIQALKFIYMHSFNVLIFFSQTLCSLIVVCCLVIQSWPTLCNPLDCSLPVSSVHDILQGRILEWVAISSSGASSWPRDWTHVSCVGSHMRVGRPEDLFHPCPGEC